MEDRIYYNLGWDYAAHGVCKPKDALQELIDGYAAGQAHFGIKTLAADRYVRKWLQLRYNAAKRNRPFSDQVTVNFLRAIDTEYCPITDEKLTHGLILPSDWSCDRVINDGAYTRQNLMVMSTRANEAKGTLSLEHIRKIIRCGGAEGLTLDQWKRLFVVIQAAHGLAGLLPGDPSIEPIFRGFPWHLFSYWHDFLQVEIALYVHARCVPGFKLSGRFAKSIARVKRSCQDNVTSKQMFDKMVKLAERRLAKHRGNFDVFWDNRVLTVFKELLEFQTARHAWPTDLGNTGVELTEESQANMRREAAYDTRGYFAHA